MVVVGLVGVLLLPLVHYQWSTRCAIHLGGGLRGVAADDDGTEVAVHVVALELCHLQIRPRMVEVHVVDEAARVGIALHLVACIDRILIDKHTDGLGLADHRQRSHLYALCITHHLRLVEVEEE